MKVGMTPEVQNREVAESLFGSVSAHLAHSHEAPEGLSHFHVEHVWDVELLALPE